MKEVKNYALCVISDLVASFLYYDRKEDDYLPVGKIEELIANKELSVDDIVSEFRRNLIGSL